MKFEYDTDAILQSTDVESARSRYRVARVAVEIEMLRRRAMAAGMTADEWLRALTGEVEIHKMRHGHK